MNLVKFQALQNDLNNRRIREIIMASGLTINVYEPSKEDVGVILDLQERWVDPENPEVRTITGVDIIRDLFPILTDLEGIEEMTDEEIQHVADNPSLAYLQLQIEVETILTEVYKTHVLSARKNLLDTDFQLEATKVEAETFNRSIALAIKNTGATDLIDRIDQYAQGMDKIAEGKAEKEKEATMTKLAEIEKDTDEQINKYKDVLAEKYGSFLE